MPKENLFNSVTKFASLILRHKPGDYSVSIDPHGFADLDNVVAVICLEMNLKNEEVLEKLREDNERFIFKNGKIASKYGHSIDVTPICKPTEPPKFLYHGTSREARRKIETEGLKSMKRKFVHLSKTVENAEKTGKRKDEEPVIITVLAREAYHNGIKFYDVGPLYLSENIPGEFLLFKKKGFEEILISIPGKEAEEIKRRAVEEGLLYKEYISSILHKFVNGKLIEREQQ